MRDACVAQCHQEQLFSTSKGASNGDEEKSSEEGREEAGEKSGEEKSCEEVKLSSLRSRALESPGRSHSQCDVRTFRAERAAERLPFLFVPIDPMFDSIDGPCAGRARRRVLRPPLHRTSITRRGASTKREKPDSLRSRALESLGRSHSQCDAQTFGAERAARRLPFLLMLLVCCRRLVREGTKHDLRMILAKARPGKHANFCIAGGQKKPAARPGRDGRHNSLIFRNAARPESRPGGLPGPPGGPNSGDRPPGGS